MIAVYRFTDKEVGGVAYSYEELYKATFTPTEYDILLLNGAHGATYKERKHSIEEQAIEYSNMRNIDISFYDLVNIQDYFTKYGKRYGLLQDFHENVIC